MICRECSEYMELVDEGEDEDGLRYDMFLCIECGHTEAVRQPGGEDDLSASAPHYEWDPPDGSRWRGKRQP
jgi:hypothetical protein